MAATLWRNLCVVILVREPHDVVVSVVCRNEDTCVALPGCGERASGNSSCLCATPPCAVRQDASDPCQQRLRIPHAVRAAPTLQAHQIHVSSSARPCTSRCRDARSVLPSSHHSPSLSLRANLPGRPMEGVTLGWPMAAWSAARRTLFAFTAAASAMVARAVSASIPSCHSAACPGIMPRYRTGRLRHHSCWGKRTTECVGERGRHQGNTAA